MVARAAGAAAGRSGSHMHASPRPARTPVPQEPAAVAGAEQVQYTLPGCARLCQLLCRSSPRSDPAWRHWPARCGRCQSCASHSPPTSPSSPSGGRKRGGEQSRRAGVSRAGQGSVSGVRRARCEPTTAAAIPHQCEKQQSNVRKHGQVAAAGRTVSSSTVISTSADAATASAARRAGSLQAGHRAPRVACQCVPRAQCA